MEAVGVLARGASGTFVIKFTGAALSYGVQILLARLLGVDKFGDYVYVLSWLNLLSLFASTGMQPGSHRFLAEYKGKQQWGHMRGFLRFSRIATTTASILISTVFAATALLLGERIGDGLRAALCIGAVLMPFLVWLQLHCAALRALKKVILAQSLLEIARPGLIGFGVFLVYAMVREALEASHAIAINTTATCCLLIVSMLLLRRYLPADMKQASLPEKSERPAIWKFWLRVSTSFFLTEGFYVVIAQADIILIGIFLDPSAAGVYAVARRLASVVDYGILAANAIAAPMFAEMHATGKIDQMKYIVSRAALWIALIASAIALLLVVLGDWILGWFGPAFHGGYIALVILAVARLFSSLAGTGGILMAMTGHHAQRTKIMAAAACINVVCNAVVIPRFGFLGAAVVSAITFFFWNTAMLIYVVTKMKINPTLLQRKKPTER